MTKQEIDKLSEELHCQYKDVLEVNSKLNRKVVSFQGNKKKPFYRWFKYKEAYSSSLVEYFLKTYSVNNGELIDPFAGIGTSLFASSSNGLKSLGIELLPIGYEIMKTRNLIHISDNLKLEQTLKSVLEKQPWLNGYNGEPLNELRITKGAYPEETKNQLEKYLGYISTIDEELSHSVLKIALLSILEEISYTRKDGQYLRWDGRAKGRESKFRKSKILSFSEAITKKLSMILEDITFEQDFFKNNNSIKKGDVNLIKGSVLNELSNFSNNKFQCLITSPPYCNRYDYTRTYALELALLNTSEEELKDMRQKMLSCTVENRKKSIDDISISTNEAEKSFESHSLLQAILANLTYKKESKKLNNNGIPRMIEGYFRELSHVIYESYRILDKGAYMIMVNDNVRYTGITIPVDLILSDFAKDAGFEIEKIWVLPVGKGNSSQQMGKHGREQLRKCVYVWKKL